MYDVTISGTVSRVIRRRRARPTCPPYNQRPTTAHPGRRLLPRPSSPPAGTLQLPPGDHEMALWVADRRGALARSPTRSVLVHERPPLRSTRSRRSRVTSPCLSSTTSCSRHQTSVPHAALRRPHPRLQRVAAAPLWIGGLVTRPQRREHTREHRPQSRLEHDDTLPGPRHNHAKPR